KTVLAAGPDRHSSVPDVSQQIVGQLGPPTPAEAAARLAAGLPVSVKVGVNGLERVFEQQLAGRAGGDLLAGVRSLAHAPAHRGHSVRTTIDVGLERAASAALGGRYGGIAVLRPKNGE